MAMFKPVPNRHVISGVDANGESTPVAYRLTYKRGDVPADEVSLRLPYTFLRWEVRERREEGYDAEVEPLLEMPDELLEKWMVLHLHRMMPPSARSAFGELAGLAIRRAEQIRCGNIAERNGESLFAAVEPGCDEVLDLVFTRGKPFIYSRVGEEWVHSDGIGDLDYQCFAMNSVADAALKLYDERREAGQLLMLSELRERGMTGDVRRH